MVNRNIIYLMAALALLTQIVMSVILITLQLNAQASRQAIRSQNNFVVCVLQIQPSMRTQAVVDKCRNDNLGK